MPETPDVPAHLLEGFDNSEVADLPELAAAGEAIRVLAECLGRLARKADQPWVPDVVDLVADIAHGLTFADNCRQCSGDDVYRARQPYAMQAIKPTQVQCGYSHRTATGEVHRWTETWDVDLARIGPG